MCLGIPGKVICIVDREKALGTVDMGGVTRTVNLLCVVDEQRSIDNCVGIWVLVHVGFAMQVLDEAEAKRTISLLDEMGRNNEIRG